MPPADFALLSTLTLSECLSPPGLHIHVGSIWASQTASPADYHMMRSRNAVSRNMEAFVGTGFVRIQRIAWRCSRWQLRVYCGCNWTRVVKAHCEMAASAMTPPQAVWKHAASVLKMCQRGQVGGVAKLSSPCHLRLRILPTLWTLGRSDHVYSASTIAQTYTYHGAS